MHAAKSSEAEQVALRQTAAAWMVRRDRGLSATESIEYELWLAADPRHAAAMRTLAEAWKVAQLQGQKFSPLRAFYLATLGGARALGLADRIGRLEPGYEADLVVLDPKATPLAEQRDRLCKTVIERLFALMMLGDDRSIAETWILGRPWRGRTPVGAAPAA